MNNLSRGGRGLQEYRVCNLQAEPVLESISELQTDFSLNLNTSNSFANLEVNVRDEEEDQENIEVVQVENEVVS